MKKTLLFSVASAALLAASSVQAALNLVQDPGFEGGEIGPIIASSGPWFDPTSSGNTSINTSFPLTGAYSAELVSPAAGDAFLFQNLSLTMGVGYTINFWVADPGQLGGTLTVLLGGSLAGVIPVAPGTAYVDYNLNATPASGLLGFFWSGNLPGAAAYIDNVSVVVPEPTTIVAGALMLLPFAASTLRLRKKASA